MLDTITVPQPQASTKKTNIVKLDKYGIKHLIGIALDQLLDGKAVSDTIESGDCKATVKLIERKIGKIAFEITVERQHAAPSEKGG